MGKWHFFRPGALDQVRDQEGERTRVSVRTIEVIDVDCVHDVNVQPLCAKWTCTKVQNTTIWKPHKSSRAGRKHNGLWQKCCQGAEKREFQLCNTSWHVWLRTLPSTCNTNWHVLRTLPSTFTLIISYSFPLFLLLSHTCKPIFNWKNNPKRGWEVGGNCWKATSK